jgi:hypothetical protein
MRKEFIRLEIRLTPELARALDEWRRRQPDLPSKTEAIRRLIEAGTKAEQKTRKARSEKT